MTYTTEFKSWLISHYAGRLAEEKQKGNTAAVSFLRSTLVNLKNQQ